jgi:PAS domain-containing protein
MASQSVELILLKQVAGYLATPVFLVDPDGMLLFYNEPAEEILGLRYEETGEMPLTEWGTMFQPTDSSGAAIAPENLPIAVALREDRPVQGDYWMKGMDGVARHLAITVLPLDGERGVNLGAMAVVWRLDSEGGEP